jgi:hypothetical protein
MYRSTLTVILYKYELMTVDTNTNKIIKNKMVAMCKKNAKISGPYGYLPEGKQTSDMQNLFSDTL